MPAATEPKQAGPTPCSVTAAHARGRGVASRALEALTNWAFDAFEADGLERLELLHQVDNLTSCRVAQKSRYDSKRWAPAGPGADVSVPRRVV